MLQKNNVELTGAADGLHLVDTHCHIHSADYPIPIAEVDAASQQAGVDFLICVGCDAADSERAVAFVADRPNSFASVGLHPHEAKYGRAPLERLRQLVEADQTTRPLSSRTAPQPVASGLAWGSARFDVVPNVKEGANAGTRLATVPFRDVSDNSTQNAPFSSLPSDRYTRAQTGVSVRTGHGGSAEAKEKGVPRSTLSPGLSDTLPATPPSAGYGTLTNSSLSSLGKREPLTEGGDDEGYGTEGRNATSRSKIIAIGECGLDYFYGHSSKSDQEKALRYQIELALGYDLPLIFHVRDAFDDFWPIFDSYTGIRGELHSFTDNQANADKALERGLFIGVNGIMSFTKNSWQLEVAKAIPDNRLLLETDSPFLTPTPLRGTVNMPARVETIARFMSELRSVPTQRLAAQTTANARQLFSF